jgi:phosphatidylglycerophosphate synthase
MIAQLNDHGDTVPMLRRGPLLGLAAQLAALAALALTVGLGRTGWVTGVGYGLVLCAALSRGMSVLGVGGLGPADRVTLTRATLVGCVTALTADSFQHPAGLNVLVTIAAVALVLDAVDGYVARTTRTASPLGAWFDQEVDAFLLLVLSLFVARSLGTWVIAIGAMRYAFLVAGWVLAWMRQPLPPRYWRKVVAAVQGVVLVVAAAGVLAPTLAGFAVAGALVLLVESFGRDVAWLWVRTAVLPGLPVQPARR